MSDFYPQPPVIPNNPSQGLTNKFKLPLRFKKKSGTTDEGKNFEHLYIANLILKLITNENVEDFRISSNDEALGSFDDIIFEVKYYGKEKNEVYAIQSKHSSSHKSLISDALIAPKGNFSIKKYLESCGTNLLDGSVKFILLTNYKANLENKKLQIESNSEKINLDVLNIPQEHLVITSTNGLCYAFVSDKRQEFFQHFFLYTNQECADRLEKQTSELFQKIFNCETSIFTEYINFITKWSLIDGNKDTLDKKWIMKSIFLQVVTPFVRSLKFSPQESVYEKRRIFRDAISEFDITTVNGCYYEDIKILWVDGPNSLSNFEAVKTVKMKYQLALNQIQKLDDLNQEDKDISKLMWLLGRCPLIIESCRQVYKAIAACKQKHLIVLDYEAQMLNTQELSIFQKLSNLQKNITINEEILKTFTYSLEGQTEAALHHLIDLDKNFGNMITTNELVQMLKGPLLIGKNEETLPPCHIERKVSNILIDSEFLAEISKNTIVTVSCVKEVDTFGLSLPKDITIIRLKNYFDLNFGLWKVGSKFIYISEDNLAQEMFQDIHLEGLARVHHFIYLKSDSMQWIASKNYAKHSKNIDQFEDYRIDDEEDEYTTPESRLSEIEGSINIFCANPGMGKSTLMRSLKHRTPSSLWAIVISARNHGFHLKKSDKDVEKFLECILSNKVKDIGENNLVFQVFRALIQKRRIHVIWDGLDEISKNSLEITFTMVECFLQKGVKQWLSSRTNLKSLLERKFDVFARNIKEFDEEEQKEYIRNRLDIAPDELSKIFGKITLNVLSLSNTDILGIPLQIYMLTELLSRNKDKYLNQLDGVFTILDLYRHFVDEKFYVLYVDKLKQVLDIEENYKNFEKEKKKKLKCYKQAARIIYLDDLIDIGYDEEVQSVKKIKKTGDAVGFLNLGKHVFEFTHNSYGEYFAAVFLFENDPHIVEKSSFSSNSMYKHIRFFLDLMLCRERKAFVAVLCKNVPLLNQCSEKDFRYTDEIGRDIEDLAFTWVKKEKKHSTLTESIEKIRWKSITPEHLSKHFNHIEHSLPFVLEKLVYLVPFILCFYDYRRHFFDEDSSKCILYYAIKFDYANIFDNTEDVLLLDDIFTKRDLRNIIYFSLKYKSRNILEKMIDLEKISHKYLVSVLPSILTELHGRRDDILLWMLERLNINLMNFITIHEACEKYNAVVVKLMIEQGAKLDALDGKKQTPLHLAVENHTLGREIVTLLLNYGVNTEIKNDEGELPIHGACVFQKVDVIQNLINKGAKINIPDSSGNFPLHIACNSQWIDNDISILLIKEGAEINVPNANGEFPIHGACFFGKICIVQLLLNKGAKIDIPDVYGYLPIHRACMAWGNVNVVQLLIDNGARINIPDADGELPIHKACRVRLNLDVIKLLLKKGAEINIPNLKGQLPIHFACSYGKVDVVEMLVSYGAKMNVLDSKGELPIHKARRKRNTDVVDYLECYNSVEKILRHKSKK